MGQPYSDCSEQKWLEEYRGLASTLNFVPDYIYSDTAAQAVCRQEEILKYACPSIYKNKTSWVHLYFFIYKMLKFVEAYVSN